MSLADFMLPQVSHQSFRLTDLAGIVPPSRLFAGYDPARKELLIDGILKDGVDELTPEALAIDLKPIRNTQFIDSLPSTPKKPVLWDMEDGRAFGSRVFTGKDLNVFQYNRRIGERHAVLWRLISYFEPSRSMGHGGWVEDRLQFEDKKPVVYWRGAISGSRWSGPHQRSGALTVDSPDAFRELSPYFSRFRAALLSESSEAFDFKIAGPGNILEAKPWLADLGVISDDVRPAQQLEHKYMLCLNGNDVASNLYWILASQSVAFKEDCFYEVVPDYFLKPWIHYVPIASGLADLQEKFDYCEANPDICRRIIDNANQAYSQMIDPETWNNAELQVLDRLGII